MPWVPELDDLPQTHLLRGKTKFISFSIFWEIKKFMKKKKKEFHDVRELSGHYFCETLFNKRILLPTHNLSASFLNEGDFSDSSDVSVGMKKLMRSPQTFQWYSSHSLDYIQEEIISFLSGKKKWLSWMLCEHVSCETGSRLLWKEKYLFIVMHYF